MKRKIVQHGSCSLTVSLPYAWARKFSLKKGDDVEVEEAGHSVRISAVGEHTPTRAVINIEDKNKFLKRYVINLYRQGYDEIEIISKETLPMDKIRLVLNEITGFEIAEQGQKKCLLKSIAQVMDSQFDTMLRRAFLIDISQSKELLDALSRGAYDELEEISQMQDTNNKITNFCLRILTSRGYKEHHKTLLMSSMIDQIEQVSDHLGDMALYFSENRIKINEKILKEFESIIRLLEFAYEVFYCTTSDRIISLKNKVARQQESLLRLYGELSGRQMVAAMYLMQMAERINHMSAYMVQL